MKERGDGQRRQSTGRDRRQFVTILPQFTNLFGHLWVAPQGEELKAVAFNPLPVCLMGGQTDTVAVALEGYAQGQEGLHVSTSANNLVPWGGSTRSAPAINVRAQWIFSRPAFVLVIQAEKKPARDSVEVTRVCMLACCA